MAECFAFFGLLSVVVDLNSVHKIFFTLWFGNIGCAVCSKWQTNVHFIHLFTLIRLYCYCICFEVHAEDFRAGASKTRFLLHFIPCCSVLLYVVQTFYFVQFSISISFIKHFPFTVSVHDISQTIILNFNAQLFLVLFYWFLHFKFIHIYLCIQFTSVRVCVFLVLSTCKYTLTCSTFVQYPFARFYISATSNYTKN